MIRVQGLTKVFAGAGGSTVRAVDGISFEVSAGEIFGLLGPNGAGKTTTLRLLATILKPTGGGAVLGGCDVAKDPEGVRRRIGFLSGDMGLYDRLTPRETLRFFGRLNGLDGALLGGRVDAMLAAFQLQDVADSRLDRLSTGMRQRVAIARALVHDPPILILDEPTSGLDVPASRAIEEFILQARNEGKAILLSTHFMEEAEYLCDRIAVLHQGRIRTSGTMPELRELTGKQRLRDVFLQLLGMPEVSRSSVHAS